MPHSPTPRNPSSSAGGSPGGNGAPPRIDPYETVDLKEDKKKIKEEDKAAPSQASPAEHEEEVLASVTSCTHSPHAGISFLVLMFVTEHYFLCRGTNWSLILPLYTNTPISLSLLLSLLLFPLSTIETQSLC